MLVALAIAELSNFRIISDDFLWVVCNINKASVTEQYLIKSATNLAFLGLTLWILTDAFTDLFKISCKDIISFLYLHHDH